MEELILEETGETFNDVKHITMSAPSNENLGILVAVLDHQTNELLYLKANLFYNVSEEHFSAMQSYTMDGLGEKITKEELDRAKEGEITLMFSPCVHTSVWLCIYHCGIWTLAFGAPGAIGCGAICAYAFTYACS